MKNEQSLSLIQQSLTLKTNNLLKKEKYQKKQKDKKPQVTKKIRKIKKMPAEFFDVPLRNIT